VGVSHLADFARGRRAASATDGDADASAIAALAELLSAGGFSGSAPLACRLIDEFGSLSALLAAEPEAHARVAGATLKMGAYLRSVRSAMLHVLKSDIVGRSVLSCSDALIAYLKVSLAHTTEEQLRVLFLNARNELLRDEQSFSGSATAVAIRPRPIIKRAIELGATAIILVHNHPSGDPSPSPDDIDATSALIAAARPLEIEVHDHIIIGHTTWTSLRTNGQMRHAA